MDTSLYCQGLVHCIHMNGAPRVAPTSWCPEPSRVGISSPQHSFISAVPRERTLQSVETYMRNNYKLYGAVLVIPLDPQNATHLIRFLFPFDR